MTIDFEPDPSPAAAIDFEPDPDPKRPAATPAPAAPEDRYAAMASAPTPFAAPSVDFELAGPKMPELAYPDIDLARIVNDPSIPAEVTIGPAPTFTGEIKDGNYRNAGSMAYEVLRRPFSGLLGPTDAERSEQMVPWGKNPDGSTHYEYKPMADRLAREHGLMTSFVPTPHLEAEAGDSALTGTGKAVANTAMGLVGSFMSPAGVLLPGLGEVPQAGKAVSGLFAADMLASVPGQVAGVRDSPTVQGKVESGLGAVTGLVFGTLATGHATSGKAPAAPPELARVAAAADMPATAAEIAKGKSADPVPEPPKPNESPEPKQEPPGKSEEPPASSTPADEPISFEPTPENEGTGATPGGEVPAADVDPASVPEIHRPAFDLLEGLKGPAAKRTVIEHDAEPRAPKTEPPPAEEPAPAPAAPVADVPTETEVTGLRTEEVPLDQLQLSEDVPQFKSGADASGVVEPLAGKFDRTGVGPIQIWRRKDGRLEVISGRHRFDLARRSGEKTIPGQIHDEAAGFDVRAAARLDAELNIRDGQGSTADYANYFRNSEVAEEDASARGLLARAKGRAGFAIARNESEDVFALHQSKRLTDAQAETVANAAPGNDAAQRIGLRAMNAGASIADAGNAIRAAVAASKVEKSTQGDFFSDTGLDEQWLSQGRIASARQKALRDDISAVQGAAKKPELAKKYGVDVQDPAGVQKRITELRDELNRWESWPSHPDLVKITMGEEPAPAAAPISYVQPERVRNRPPGEREEIVTVDVQAFDKAWSKDSGFYVGKGGKGEIKGRRAGFEDWLKKNPGVPIETPEVSIAADGTPTFTNGRHRFSVLRDKGEKTVQVSMTPEDAARARKAGLTPKPREGIFQPADEPFNLTAESAGERMARLAREEREAQAKADEQAAKDRAESEKNQGDLFASKREKLSAEDAIEARDSFDETDPDTWPADLRKSADPKTPFQEVDREDWDSWKWALSKEERAWLDKEGPDSYVDFDAEKGKWVNGIEEREPGDEVEFQHAEDTAKRLNELADKAEGEYKSRQSDAVNRFMALDEQLKQDFLFSHTPATPEGIMLQRLTAAAEKAPTEAEWDAAGRSPNQIEVERPSGGKIVVLNTREAIVKASDKYRPPSDSSHLQRVFEAVEPLKEKAPGLRVRVLRNEADLPERVRSALNPRDAHEGIVDPDRGDVYLFSDNLRSPARALEVFAHEVVGHYGVERIIEPAEWQRVADSVIEESPQAARDIARKYADGKALKDLTPDERALIAREYVARMAEKPAIAPRTWERVVQAVRTALRKLGIVKEWTEGDIRDLLRRSAREVENPQLGKKGNSASLRAVRDLGAEVGEHSPYATAIEDAFHAAVPDEAQRAAVNAYVRDKLDGKEPAALPPETAGVAERFLTYFRNKQEFAERNGVKDQASAAYANQTAGKPDMQLPDRLAIFDSEINKAVTAKTSARSETDISRAGDSKSPTSIRNAVVDEERAKRGLPPAMEPARRDFGTVWDDAMRRIDADSDAPRDLVDQLDSHPRALTDTEDAMLLHRQITLHNEYDAAARDAVRASDAGDLAGAEEARLRTAFLSDELHRLYNVGKKVGTETGRGLNARKMMAMEDYSLASMVQRKRAANGGKPLAPEVQAEVEKAASDLKTAQEKADAAEAHVETENATAVATEALKDLTRKSPPRPKKAPPAPPEAKPPAKATANWIEKQALAARERIRQRGGRLNVGIDPFDLADRVIIAAADIAGGLRDFAGWAQKQLAEWGEEIKPHLNEMWNRANAMLGQHADVADLSAKMAARVEEGATLGQLRPYVQKIATRLVNSGITELEPLLDALHPIVEAAVEGTTRRETMDLFSGYGDFKPLDKTPLKAQVRDLKGQAQQIGKLQDMKAGNAPKKTGVEQREPSDKERALIKQVEEAKKKGGFKVTDPTTQLRTALEAVKKRLRNQIVDMAARFETGERPAAKKGIEYDAEAERLRGLRDAMKKTLADIEDKPTMTEEQRARHAADAIKRGIDEYNRRLEEEDFAPKKGKPPVSTPELDALRAQRDALKAEYEEFRELDGAVQAEKAAKREADLAGQIAKLDDRLRTGDLGTKPAKAGEPTQRAEDLKAERDAMQKQLDAMRREANRPVLTDAEKQAAADRRALAGFKTRTQQRIAELTAKLAAGDFSPRPPRRALTLDADALKAKADLQRIKDEFERGLIKDRLSKRGTFERTMDGAAKWRRAFVLSGVHTIVKLASAATEIIGIAPIEEAIGGVAGKLPVVRRAAAQAPRHGGFNIRAEAEAIAANFTKLFSDFSDYARKGGTDLDAVYGESHLYPFEWKELVGRMHGALKTPARRNEFTRAYRKRLEFAAEKGADITDPLVQTKIGADAYKDAQKSIFMEDNRLVDMYKRALSRVTQADKRTGKVTLTDKISETAIKLTFPVVRIPTNIVARTFEYSFGMVTGSFKLARALRAGIDNLHPDEADLIMQNLKRGSLGATVLLIGFFNPENVGGYYSGKRDEKDVKVGAVKLFGHEIPKLLVHNPLLEQLQIGATIRRVAESKLRKSDKDTQGLTPGIMAAAMGLVTEIPFADTVKRYGKALANPQQMFHHLSEQLRSMVTPQILQEAAELEDKLHTKGTVFADVPRRDPKGLIQNLEMGIPGLRRNVKEKPKPKK